QGTHREERSQAILKKLFYEVMAYIQPICICLNNKVSVLELVISRHGLLALNMRLARLVNFKMILFQQQTDLMKTRSDSRLVDSGCLTMSPLPAIGSELLIELECIMQGQVLW